LAAAVGAVAVAVAWRARSRPSAPAAFSGHLETSTPEAIDAFWTEERLDSAQPDEGGTIDPEYLADLEALHRRLPWLPEAQTRTLLHLLCRIKRLLPMACAPG
jgi:hypothetical protein